MCNVKSQGERPPGLSAAPPAAADVDRPAALTPGCPGPYTQAADAEQAAPPRRAPLHHLAGAARPEGGAARTGGDRYPGGAGLGAGAGRADPRPQAASREVPAAEAAERGAQPASPRHGPARPAAPHTVLAARSLRAPRPAAGKEDARAPRLLGSWGGEGARRLRDVLTTGPRSES